MEEKNKIEKKIKRRRISLITLTLIFITLACVTAAKYKAQLEKLETHNERVRELEEKIAEESQRAVDLQERKKYTNSQEYLEELARDRMGLIADDEILIVPNKN